MKNVVFCRNYRIFASAKKQMRIDNKFVELASESPLIASDRAVCLAKNS